MSSAVGAGGLLRGVGSRVRRGVHNVALSAQTAGPLTKPRKIYLIGSLKNPALPDVGRKLREAGHEVFDDWHGSGPDADVYWREYEQSRGYNYVQALGRPLADVHFRLDLRWLNWADTRILLTPAGKSGHMELGWRLRPEDEAHILLHKEPEDWDLMYKLADRVWYTIASLIAHLALPRRIDAY